MPPKEPAPCCAGGGPPAPDGSTDWRLPGSVLGKVADRLVVEKMQSRDFRHSLENLKLLAEA